ncbi:hypothetical protein [Edaphobacter modestus]|uniref:Uncharacterized protein n=1 Tax=Edaphobacter modestus TaxID=388466 RepID=A0A4Q7YEN8_9BACT|nr:hypothetical protein [Edaphobacter modestus]RZU35448.1 hypothetical protein BDD14_5497 [Edaphobacter modestus]
MGKKQNIVIGCCFFAVALLLAVYGAGFSWRAVIVTGGAFFLAGVGHEFWKSAHAPQPFARFQFRIGMNIGEALHDAGLYNDALSEAAGLISKDMPGRGWIVFTWLEPELFYVNTTNHYSSTLEINIDLPAYGDRVSKRTFELSDQIEMRTTTEGYELALLTREQLYSLHGSTRGKGLVMFMLPYKFFWALQRGYESHDKAREILTAAGFTYQSDAEVMSAWDYRNKYGSLRWWDV